MKRFCAIVVVAILALSAAPLDARMAAIAQGRPEAGAHWVTTWKTALIGRPPYPPSDPAAAPPAAPTAEDIIAGHRQLIERAHAHGLTNNGATLTPFEGAAYYTAAGEAKRAAVNAWIRTGKAYDGVIDFDAIVRDPDNPKRFLSKYDRGDHLHPGDAGYEAMGNAVELSLFGAGAMSQSGALSYPVAKKGDVVDDYAGGKIADPYRWMEDLDSPDVKAWVDAQNAITFRYLDALPERDAFKKRITELYNYPRVSTPFFEGRHWFFSRNTGLQKQSVVFMREALAGQEKVLIDPNEISPEGTTSLAGYVPSPDGQHVAFGLAVGGSDLETYYVKDITTGKQLPDEIKWMKFTGVNWTKDGKGFFYSRFPEPPPGKGLQVADRDQRIYYHRLGTTQDKDPMLYERPDVPTLFVDPQLDETGRYLLIYTNEGTSEKNELFLKDLGDPLKPKIDAPIRPLYPGHTAAYEPLGVVNGRLYLRTDREAPNSKIVAVPIDRPDFANWKLIVPEAKSAIDSAHMIAGKIAVNRMVDVASEVTFYTLDGSKAIDITPPSLGTIAGPFGRFDRSDVFYQFTSPLSPTTVYRFDPATGKSTPFEPPKLTFDPSPYMTERVFFASKDGTRVPMFITRRKNLKKDGTNPAMLYGYGGFDISTNPTFRSDIPAWLEQGGVWATANMRGGSEYGEAWHHAGMLEKKQNVFDDFIAAAEYLVREKYASPQTLGIMGGSNGGLLVGAVMEQRPDLFAVALPAVGVMDMLRYDKFTAGVGWVTEYGSATDPKAFDYLIKYSPLHNVKPGTCYPATLATTADHDDRVVPSHTFKFIAALQTAQSCSKPVLVRIETLGSHGYRPVDKRIAELADEWGFALANMKR
jgi:prolyl oligopeptidase